MADHSAFFYGTLMFPEVVYRVCYGTPYPTPFQASLLTFQPAILRGYVRRKVRFCDYPGITAAAAPASVRGTYVYGLTDGDMWRLGIFEGSEYERRKVKVRLLTKEVVGRESRAEWEGYDLVERCVEGEREREREVEVEADTYVYIAGDERLEEGEWNFAEFKRDKLKRWTGIDEDEYYKEVDEAVTDVGDISTANHEPKNSPSSQLKTESIEQLLGSAV